MVCQQINEKEMIKLEHHLFVAPNELMHLGIKHRLLLISKRERKPDIRYLLIEEGVFLKKSKLI